MIFIQIGKAFTSPQTAVMFRNNGDMDTSSYICSENILPGEGFDSVHYEVKISPEALIASLNTLGIFEPIKLRNITND